MTKRTSALRTRAPSLELSDRLCDRGPAARSVEVPLEQIDQANELFSVRIELEWESILESLRDVGQKTPIQLWPVGDHFVIIDGFRRAQAARRLKWRTLRALIRSDLDEEGAHALGFVVNVTAKTLLPIERAIAVWRAVEVRKKAKPEVASSLGLSVRQIDRYLSLLELAPVLRSAVSSGKLKMAHAFEIHRFALSSPDQARWVAKAQEGQLCARELRTSIEAETKPKRRRPSLLVRDERGFRLRAIAYRYSASRAEKIAWREALRIALDLAEEAEKPLDSENS